MEPKFFPKNKLNSMPRLSIRSSLNNLKHKKSAFKGPFFIENNQIISQNREWIFQQPLDREGSVALPSDLRVRL